MSTTTTTKRPARLRKLLVTVASVKLSNAGAWTPGGRADIADWLRRVADDLEKYGSEYGPTFTARRTADAKSA